MALTETYVDPSIDADSGAGTIGDPYGDVQHALDTMTRDASNGDRLNIRSGTDENLTGSLDLSGYGVPNQNAPLTFQGYDTSPGDGGTGVFDCSGFALLGVKQGVNWCDLRVHNVSSSATSALVCYRGAMHGVEFHNIDTDAVLMSDGMVTSCHFHDISGKGVSLGQSNTGRVVGNYFKNDGSKNMTHCIAGPTATSIYGAVCRDNVISISGATNGIRIYYASECSNNSILSDGGTGTGIESARGYYSGWNFNNLIEGFSGDGGAAMKLGAAYGEYFAIIAANSEYNNATGINQNGRYAVVSDSNETLTESPFARTGSDTFVNRKNYFAPVDTGDVMSGMNNRVRGAITPSSSGSSNVIVIED